MRWSLNRKSDDYSGISFDETPQLYVSYARRGDPGVLNSMVAHLKAVSQGLDHYSTPLCEPVYNNQIKLFVECSSNEVPDSRSSREKFLERVQSISSGTLVFFSNPYYGSKRSLVELQQAKSKPSMALVLDSGLNDDVKDNFSRKIKPHCDKDSQSFDHWYRRASQANQFVGGTQSLPCANLNFSKFSCSRCRRTPKIVCDRCSDFKAHMENKKFTESVQNLANMINQFAPAIMEHHTRSMLSDLDFSLGSDNVSGNRHSLSSENPRYTSEPVERNMSDDDMMDVDYGGNRASRMIKRGLRQFPSWTRRNESEDKSSSRPSRRAASKSRSHSRSKSRSASKHRSHRSKSRSRSSSTKHKRREETDRVIYISTSENHPCHEEAIAMPPKEQREKGIIYVVDGVRKKWDGRQWRRLCMIVGCGSAARGSTSYCVQHRKESECQKSNCKSESFGSSKRCPKHGGSKPSRDGSGDGIREKFENIVGKKKVRKGSSSYGTTICANAKCRAEAIPGSDMCMEHEGRCPFKTALGDSCGNESDYRYAPLCFSCWCYVNDVPAEGIVNDVFKTFGSSPTSLSALDEQFL